MGAALAVRSGVSWLSNEPFPVAALAGTLRLSTTFEVGGEGIFGLRRVRLTPEGSPNRSEVGTGYGGILLMWRPAGDAPGIRWAGGLLLGAGAARIRSPLAGTPGITENYFVLEPRIQLGVAQDRRLRFHGEAAYRIALTADPPTGIGTAELPPQGRHALAGRPVRARSVGAACIRPSARERVPFDSAGCRRETGTDHGDRTPGPPGRRDDPATAARRLPVDVRRVRRLRRRPAEGCGAAPVRKTHPRGRARRNRSRRARRREDFPRARAVPRASRYRASRR